LAAFDRKTQRQQGDLATRPRLLPAVDRSRAREAGPLMWVGAWVALEWLERPNDLTHLNGGLAPLRRHSTLALEGGYSPILFQNSMQF
jgi:hypothetical protein